LPDDLERWIGSTEETVGLITAWPVAALQATLGIDLSPVEEGDELPPMWHWLFFLPAVHRSGLGSDGHPKRGEFLPPVALPRRMFAGGRTRFIKPLRIGEVGRRIGTVTSIAEKDGRSGRLTFVTARYEISTGGEAAIVEEQDFVYRQAASGPQLPEPGTDPVPTSDWIQTVDPDPVLLFRFSALTFNGHRIHYDFPYVTQVEGYPNLVVHGPMIALLLIGLCRRHDPRPVFEFSFRSKAPLFVDGPFTLIGDIRETGIAELSAWSHDSRQAMTATVEFKNHERPS